jgi:hypothetical protein
MGDVNYENSAVFVLWVDMGSRKLFCEVKVFIHGHCFVVACLFCCYCGFSFASVKEDLWLFTIILPVGQVIGCWIQWCLDVVDVRGIGVAVLFVKQLLYDNQYCYHMLFMDRGWVVFLLFCYGFGIGLCFIVVWCIDVGLASNRFLFWYL